jgi:diguanylate cyclase
MSSFKQTPSDDKWKKKYLSLLDEQDRLEKDQQEKEKLLCKIITRLALLATGFSAELDPYLIQIRKQLKKGLINETLKQQLEQFSDALLKLDDAPGKQDPSLLFEFLERQFPKRQAEFKKIQMAWQKNQYSSQQDMLLALHDLIDEEQSVVSEIPQQEIDTSLVCQQLIKLLESTEIPEPFIDRAEQLKEQLQQSDDLTVLLDDTLTLLSEIKKNLLQEQQAMAEFLGQLTEQLNQLGEQTSKASESFAQSNKKRNLLDQSVSRQMQDLQQCSANATQLEALKQLVTSRLSKITEEVQQHKLQEKADQQKTQQTIEALCQKIKFLEKESQDIKENLEKARHQALRDPLTKLPNRLAYEERLQTEIDRFQRTGAPLAMAIWDIDFFKKINDTFGHKAGDKTLQIIARLLQKHCRKIDFIARFGGEEFVMLLPNTSAEAARVIAEKLRKTIESAGFNSGGNKINITVSCGLSEFSPGENGETVFKRADEALYQAKNNGRNQCVIASPPNKTP